MNQKPAPPAPEPGDNYLWDRTGTVDPEIARLEQLLSPLGLGARPAWRNPPGPEMAADDRADPPVPGGASPTRFRPRRVLAAAAMLALAATAALLSLRPAPSWGVLAVQGNPEIRAGSMSTRTLSGEGRLRIGEWLNTDAASRAQIDVAGLGHIDVAPGSRIRIKEAGQSRKLLELQRGEIHALITAPPEMFQVDTPWAQAIDLGCQYTLTVAPDGSGELRVDLGYVMLRGQGRESTVPMNGGVCLTRPGFGPGTPFFDDATAAFKTALERFDFAQGGRAALDTVMAEARPRDGLSLWHLLPRTTGPDRAAVADRLHEIKPMPATISREGVLALNKAMLKEWWEEMRPF